MTEPRRLKTSDDLGAVVALLQESFAYMDGRIDPPSSARHLSIKAIAEHCEHGEVWVIGTPPIASVFLREQPGQLYIGKLAVAPAMRGQGYARRLVDQAAKRARLKGLGLLELHTRIELVENHETFRRLGFEKVAEARHSGFDRTTYIIMQKEV